MNKLREAFMSTMQEVAKKAGVSKATVSRVLTGKGYVSEATKTLVYQAIEETGYRPNLMARNLATSKSGYIGLVVTNTLYSGNYFSELLSQAALKLEASGRQLILVDGKHSAREEQEAVQFLLDLHCDAVIIYPRFLSVDEMDLLIGQHKQPIMVMNRKLRKHQSHCICCDHKGSSYNATRHLIDKGHREIAFISGVLDSPTARERLAGYKEALEQAGLTPRDELIVAGKWTPASGAAGVENLLARGEKFSALVASNDDMAIGAIKQLSNAGLRVPDDVSIIGFDNVPTGAFLSPALSSVKEPVSDMIHEVINRLTAMLDGGYFSKDNLYASDLIVRDSVAKGPHFMAK
ncbi:LacI family DNA-binding transcriptional regulator [Cedecea davisae]|uniref:HTH-type transcriptional regulator AscG n=1 Tax=Cedecea davisae DSM 4568 TaxID=566551 RepID=S3J6Y5_9ENTR|nr:LacI family DNA-binding transcriptional regulator [Cedecea davisae]EPF15817.1 HTH-type transcriptional regulator AscG [Cedecea davisae DSM 4568]